MKKRINLLIDALGLSHRSFSLRIGKSEAFARSIKNAIGSDVLGNILREFPQVNSYWLLTGEGEMFLTKAETGMNHSTDAKIVSSLEEDNKKLSGQVDVLQDLLKSNQEIIKGFLEGNITKL